MFVNTSHGTYWVTGEPTKHERKLIGSTLTDRSVEHLIDELAILLVRTLFFPGGVVWLMVWLGTASIEGGWPWWQAPTLWLGVGLFFVGAARLAHLMVERRVKKSTTFRASDRVYQANFSYRSDCAALRHLWCSDSLLRQLRCATEGDMGLLQRHKPEVDAFLQDVRLNRLKELLKNDHPAPTWKQKQELRRKLVEAAAETAVRLHELDEPYQQLCRTENDESEAERARAADVAQLEAEAEREVLSWQIERALQDET